MSFSGAVGGATTGFKLGAATGVPHLAGIGAIGGGIAGLFGGGGGGDKNHEGNRARRQAKAQKKQWKFNNEEREKQYKYNVKSLKIRKENDEANLDYQDETNQINWNFETAKQLYSYDQAVRARDKSKENAKQKIGFNRQSAAFARQQQKRAYQEQLTKLMFDEKSMLLNYNLESAGLESQKRDFDIQSKKMMGKAQVSTQRSYVEGLEAEGEAQASGSGRSNVKAMQAAIAKAGANEQAIADELMFGLQGIDNAQDNINTRAAAMRSQLELDKLMLIETKNNIKARNKFVKQQIKFDKLQANTAARARIHLKPEMSPPIPEPLALPRPEYQDVYKPGTPPKPKKHGGMYSGGSDSSGYLQAALGTIPSIVSAYRGGGYQPNQNLGSIDFGNFQNQISDANSLFGNSMNNFGGMDFNTFGEFNGIGDFGVTGFNSFNIG